MFDPVTLVISAIVLIVGGGLGAKKLLAAPSAPAPVDDKGAAIDEFTELRDDGATTFNRTTAIGILGWMGSVSLKPVSSGPAGKVYELVPSPNGMPLEKPAGKELVRMAQQGNMILAERNITMTGRDAKRVLVVPAHAYVPDQHTPHDGELALLIEASGAPQPAQMDAPMPGFPGKRPLPVAEPKIAEATGAEETEVDPKLREIIETVLTHEESDPNALVVLAERLRLGGATKDAERLEARAADLRARTVVDGVKRRELFVIPPGHKGAAALAQKLTGDPQKVADLLKANPGLMDRGTGVVPWTSGQVVKIPKTWGRRTA